MGCEITGIGGETLRLDPPSQHGVDAPELAQLGQYGVGTRVLRFEQPDQFDVLAFDAGLGTAPRGTRRLSVDLWYPARTRPESPRALYTASFPGQPPAPPVSFSVPGIAVPEAPVEGGLHPLIIVSHGYSNAPAAMTWLTENLASKGYVVAAIRHDDPAITDRTKICEPLLRRPLDIAFVARTLRQSLGAAGLVDASRVAVIGYSLGGYGALTVAGAGLDPHGQPAQLVPGGLLLPYARGGALRQSLGIDGLRAVTVIAPAGGGAHGAWGPVGLAQINVPMLVIAGDSDRTVDYESGARAIVDHAVNVERCLLTFKGAGHSIGLNPAPAAMRSSLWDQDWFEDPIWRKDRVNAINTHFITAFLDHYVKGDATRADYLFVAVTESSAGLWPAAEPPSPYDRVQHRRRHHRVEGVPTQSRRRPAILIHASGLARVRARGSRRQPSRTG